MMKVSVNGVEYDYDEVEVGEVLDILRQDGALRGFREMQSSNKRMIAWIEAQEEKGKDDGGESGNGDPAGGGVGDGGPDPAKSDDASGDVGKGNQGKPTPPPKLTEEDKREQKPPAKPSRWWGNQISYDDDK